MAAIGPENVLSKLSFALNGRADQGALDSLRLRLTRQTQKYRTQGKTGISRQAVHQLFQGALPRRDGTYQFLHQFVREIGEDAEEYGQLPNEQKIVLGQVLAFCRRQQRGEADLEIHGASSGHVVIRQERIYPQRQYADESEYYVGTYRVFKKRLLDTGDKPISVEIMQVFKTSFHLQLKWWILLDDRKVATFDGVFLMVGTTVWGVLHNASLGGRLRVLNATKSGWGRIKPEYHTGILLSTTPHYRDPVPSACRVFIEKIKPINEEKIRVEVQHLSTRQFTHPQKELIMRIISNEHMTNGRLDALDHLLRPNNKTLTVKK
jgi:hypothetical protein